MANPLSILNNANEIAYLAGLFNWQMSNASYINPDGTTISFHVLDNIQIPLEQYIQGIINTFNLVSGQFGFNPSDPNKQLFNTNLGITQIRENINRKYAIYRVPLANYDILVDQGIGGQTINFTVAFAGTMYQTALQNFVQCLFNNQTEGLGTLNHPFYNKIENVLPININNAYNFDQLNFILLQLTFLTSDISHLNPNSIKTNLASEIGTWYIGIQNAITSIAGTIAAAKTLNNNLFSGTL